MAPSLAQDLAPQPDVRVSPKLTHDSAGNRVVTLGPDDPDNLQGAMGKLGVHNKARTLLVRHARNYPKALVTLLALPKDEVRSEFLLTRPDLIKEAAVKAAAVRGRRRWLYDDDVVEGISVTGGVQGQPRILSFIYRKASGRSSRGVLGYDEVPSIETAFQEKVQEAVVPARALVDPTAPAPEADQVVAEAEDARSAAEDALKQAQAAHAEELAAMRSSFSELKEQVEALSDPEPYEGYAELNAQDAIGDLKSRGAAYFGQVGLDRIRAYEEAHKDRSTVIGALDDLETDLPTLDPPAADA